MFSRSIAILIALIVTTTALAQQRSGRDRLDFDRLERERPAETRQDNMPNNLSELELQRQRDLQRLETQFEADRAELMSRYDVRRRQLLHSRDPRFREDDAAREIRAAEQERDRELSNLQGEYERELADVRREADRDRRPEQYEQKLTELTRKHREKRAAVWQKFEQKREQFARRFDAQAVDPLAFAGDRLDPAGRALPAAPAAIVWQHQAELDARRHENLLIPAADRINPTALPLSFGAWVKPERGHGMIFSYGGDGDGYGLYLDSGQAVLKVAGEGRGVRVESKQRLPNDQWTHVAAIMTADGNAMILINGQLSDQKPVPALKPQADAEYAFGADPAPTVTNHRDFRAPARFQGLIRDARVYRGVIDQATLDRWADPQAVR